MSEREEDGHTWRDLAEAAAGRTLSGGEADHLLWGCSAFPVASPRVVYEQIRHADRHVECADDPLRGCTNRRIRSAMERAWNERKEGRHGTAV